MRVLVISSTPWDVSNSFGNTFSNLFCGMENVEIYNICCRNGENNNEVVKKAIQATDKSALKSIYKIGYDPFWKMEITSHTTFHNEENKNLSEYALKKRKPIHFFVRDMIWKMSKCKKSKVLKDFLKEINPDIIYLPIYSQHYMCDFQNIIIEKLKVPVVGHISDDVYGIKPNVKGFEKSRSIKLQKKIEALIKKCSYVEVFAENMAKEYSKKFNVPCYLIGKGVKIEEIPADVHFTKKDKLKMVYTGVLSNYRFDTLINLGKALKKSCPNDEITIDVYSQTILTDEMKREISNCPQINFKGKIDRLDVEKVQSNADMLLHIEGFSDEAIHASKMSFSTKIIDYMLKGKVIFAIGSKDINSINVLENRNLGVVSNSVDMIEKKLTDVVNEKINFEEILSNVNEYLRNERIIDNIQREMEMRMEGLLNENSTY